MWLGRLSYYLGYHIPYLVPVQVLAIPCLIQLPAIASWETADYGLSAWAPSHVGDWMEYWTLGFRPAQP